jgi:hypothetical protein
MGDESAKPKTIDITPQYVEKTDENEHEMVKNEAKTG